MSEHAEQATLITWFFYQYRHYRGCLFAIPNGSWFMSKDRRRAAMQMNKLKREGFKNGVSDLFLMVAAGGFNGLFIEMKDKGKKASSVSEDQSDHILLARREGFRAEWCAGSEDAQLVIEEYLGQLTKETKAAVQ